MNWRSLIDPLTLSPLQRVILDCLAEVDGKKLRTPRLIERVYRGTKLPNGPNKVIRNQICRLRPKLVGTPLQIVSTKGRSATYQLILEEEGALCGA